MAESCARIVDGLRDSGIRVTLVHLTPHPGLQRLIPHENGQTLLFSREPDASHTLLRLWEVLDRLQLQQPFSHVVAFGGFLPLLGAPTFAAGWQLPLVVLLRGNDFDAALFDPLKRPMLFESLQRADKIIAVSRDKCRRIQALFPHLMPHWIPNGIDLDAFIPLPSDSSHAVDWKQQNARRLHDKTSRIVLGFFGHLKAKKGGDILLKALHKSQLGAHFHLLIIGELQPEFQPFLEQVEGLTFTVLPMMDRYQLLKWYPACDLMALPSHYDGFPNVLAEGLTLGIPILASRVGGMADILTDGQTALMFEPGDVAGCVKALQRATVLTEGEWQAMKQAARALAETALPVQLEIDRYRNLLMAAPNRT